MNLSPRHEGAAVPERRQKRGGTRLKPVIAIVGRPNVGKSQLFNKLTGQRTAIVEDTPGVTRDRIYGTADWNGRSFILVDTGGIEPRTDSQILSFMREQAEIAIDNATVIVFLTDLRSGVTASDQEVANLLQKSGKPVVLAVNKVDSTGPVDPDFYEFYNLGLGDPVAVSAVHGHGTGDLLDACLQYFPPEDGEETEDEAVKVAVIGKPNAGKSSLVNRILGEERTIVSETAGTTRDAIDSRFENAQGAFVFIDTAGIRRKSKVEDAVERYSVLRATMAIERSDVCLILIDATEGVTEQDTKVAGLAHEAGKACIIVVNKWDLVEKDGKTMDHMRGEVHNALAYMTYAPILFISAKTGQRVDRLFAMINDAAEQAARRITTGMLNDVLADAQTRVQPPTDKGRRLKIYYMTQVGVKPPHFVAFCNDAKLFHFSYRRYLENCIRNTFGLEGTPIVLSVRQRGDKEE
ncbi:MAG: ribosome biogenesis GTPase Der [Oscillibacter sp.]|nr:ribosome biogenesis GTPase Der [Oscillibacter sp.]